MPLKDNGRFDVVVAVTPERLAALLAQGVHEVGALVSKWAPSLRLPIPDALAQLLGGHFTLPISWDLHLGAGPVTLSQLPNGIRLTWTPQVTSTWSWTEIKLPAVPGTAPPPSLPAGSAPFGGLAITVNADLTAAAGQVQLTNITGAVSVDIVAVRAMPPLTYLLAWLDSQWPDWLTAALAQASGYFGSLDAVLADFAREVSAGATTLLDLALPDSLPAVSVPAGSVCLRLLGADLLVLWERSAGVGHPELVLASPIRRPPVGPADLVGVNVANGFLLGQVRAALAKLPWTASEGSFAPTHPCCWTGRHVVLNKFELGVAITGMLVALDEFNGVSFTLTMDAAHGTGGFGVTGRASTYWSVAASDDGSKLRITGDPLSVHDVDMWVAWWVYALMGVGAGPIGVLIAGLHDALDGGMFVAELNAAVGLILPKQGNTNDRVSFAVSRSTTRWPRSRPAESKLCRRGRS